MEESNFLVAEETITTKTKHEKIEYLGVAYPIGYNMPNAMRLAELFLRAFITVHPEGGNFNFWCRGSSGAILAALLVSQLDLSKYLCYICHVKKPRRIFTSAIS